MIVSPSPHLHSSLSTRRLMADVIIALLPAVILSCLLYGWKELFLLAVSIVSCVGVEYLINRFLLKKPCSVGDLSAVVTAVLLALNVPVSCPWWVLTIGAIFAIGVVKMTFGGLGQNIFNPAIAARVFLLLSFPTAMTSWDYTPTGLFGSVDAVSGPTLLGLVAEQGLDSVAGLDWTHLLINTCGGSAGELSALALIAGFVYLLARKVIKPWITLSILGTVAIFALVYALVAQPAMGVGAFVVFHLLSGGLLLGSIFMATDYVTSPMSDWGGVVYGVGIGLLTMLIRCFGAYPEGVSFAILIMNMVVPLINKGFHQRKYGRA
ncbi:MAG: RnfABCDGE type electron transport complex subunit D [Bacteroidales bacterium]|nr:RnfABCDGE type electron transport complex subunit D [Bacteroidales bacterium]MDY4562530.1 RnfABCDGE type electron transport complex subunit D [Candidatus Cryptobacteroides sp.]MDY6171360.1 RnfABCDGE type electron transport complex subunit D [Candidatus Cryptobacteroides sp.]